MIHFLKAWCFSSKHCILSKSMFSGCFNSLYSILNPVGDLEENIMVNNANQLRYWKWTLNHISALDMGHEVHVTAFEGSNVFSNWHTFYCVKLCNIFWTRASEKHAYWTSEYWVLFTCFGQTFSIAIFRIRILMLLLLRDIGITSWCLCFCWDFCLDHCSLS